MAYFNHAFQKVILGTQGVFPVTQSSTATKVWEMKDDAKGVVAFFGTKGAYKDTSIMALSTSEPFYVAGSSFRSKDMIGKFMGGYQEANKSKVINPKYVNRIYRVNHSDPTPSFVLVGNTDAENESCAKGFSCGETYYLRLDVKGSAVASAFRHNTYSRVPAYIDCCGVTGDDFSLGMDGLEVYYEWAKAISQNNLFVDFVLPIVATKQSGTYKYYAPDQAAADAFVASGIIDVLATNVKTFADLDTLLASSPSVSKAGLVILGAYVETKFGNCTFQTTDGYNIEPLRIYASEVDAEGDVCFNGVCIQQTIGQQGTGYGESVIRRVLNEDEPYHQRDFNSDLRKREIEGADGIFSVVDRNAKYDSLYILHSVPRFSNPSGIFDNDQYLVEIVGTDDVIDTLVSRLSTLVPDIDIDVNTAGVQVEEYGDEADAPTVTSVTPKSLTLAAGATGSVTAKVNPAEGELSSGQIVIGDGSGTDSVIDSATVDSTNKKKVNIAVKAGATSNDSSTVTIGGKVVTVTVS